jgi:hypothetical protein
MDPLFNREKFYSSYDYVKITEYHWNLEQFSKMIGICGDKNNNDKVQIYYCLQKYLTAKDFALNKIRDNDNKK